MRPSSKKIPHVYFNNLDALRFLAAFAVLIFHYSKDILGSIDEDTLSPMEDFLFIIADKGQLGVNFFFVLSGFLITFLILHERKHKGFFDLKKFLIRRTLRIWPLYFLIILLGFILFPLILPEYHTSHNLWMYVGFLANFDEINCGLNDSVNFLTSPWSVAVEEQFYLFWGILCLGLFQLKKISWPTLFVVLYIICFGFRWRFWNEERIIYYHTLAVFQDIVTGAFLGWSVFTKKKWTFQLQKVSKLVNVGIYLLSIVICLFKNKIFNEEWIVFERFALSLFFAYIILDQIHGKHSIIKLGRIRAFNYLGKISYGIYMYHLVVMYLIIDVCLTENTTLLGAFVYLMASILITFGIASLSYFILEKPLLKLKPK